MTAPVPLALVQHAHQYLITDGYDNHEGLSELLEGYAGVFALHLQHGVPLNLHLSGTLVEAVAWHAPEFFGWIRALRAEGLVEMVGSAYSQSILTLFGFEHNLRQLNETLDLYQRHLGVDPAEVAGFWVPERVWRTPELAAVLCSDRLRNGGYRWVVVDDRLAYSTRNGSSRPSERRRFDSRSVPGGDPGPVGSHPGGSVPTDHLRPFLIEDGLGLVALPISGHLRYCLPPRDEPQWARLRSVLGGTAAAGPDAVAVYGDDLEKTAGVGPWATRPWHPSHLEPYRALLAELAGGGLARPVLISDWLASNPPDRRRPVDPGTFYELARVAGEDYQGWWAAPAFAHHRRALRSAEAICASLGGPLGELAWKQLMACSYETGWQDTMEEPSGQPAPWARAVAAHVRTVFVIAAAAGWAQGAQPEPWAGMTDVDGDGQAEVVLANEHLYAVVSPGYGGRLVALFDLDEGRLVVGNPADDWNWQEELNRFMEVPRNHPGAFADAGHENDPWTVVGAEHGTAVLAHRRAGCSLFGSRKVFRLAAGARHLEVTYETGPLAGPVTFEAALSPDYLTLLREGRSAVELWSEGRTRRAEAGTATAWVHLPEGQPVTFTPSPQRECGHGLVVRAAAWSSPFTVHLGCGPVPATEVDLRRAGVADEVVV